MGCECALAASTGAVALCEELWCGGPVLPAAPVLLIADRYSLLLNVM